MSTSVKLKKCDFVKLKQAERHERKTCITVFNFIAIFSPFPKGNLQVFLFPCLSSRRKREPVSNVYGQ